MDSSDPKSQRGSVQSIVNHLSLWGAESLRGLARVVYVTEDARVRVVQSLKENLAERDVPLHEVEIPPGSAGQLVGHVVERLREIPEGVVSVTGFGAAHAHGEEDFLNAIRSFNFSRETIAQLPLRQIWWMPQHVADLFARATPDLNSWFILRLHLTETGIVPEKRPPSTVPTSSRFLVALSFPGEKREFVRSVAECLGEALGRERVFYDEWYEAELNRANLDTYLQEIYGEKSALVVAFFGEDYAKKPWCCKVEWSAIRAALTLGDHDDDYLMAMRFDDAPIKGFLQTHGYSDIRGRAPEDIAELILQRLASMGHYGGGREGTPSRQPGCLNNLHFATIGDLLRGREEDLRELLGGSGTAAISQAIEGMGGVGKTRLAVELGLRAVKSGDYEAVLFVIADSPESLQSNIARLAVNPLDVLTREEATDELGVFETVLDYLESHDKWFLILDNVDTDEAADVVLSLLPRLSRGRVLITSRRRGWPQTIRTRTLSVLDREEGTQYLLDATGDRTQDAERDEEDARTLAEKLDGLPLALEQAAAYIKWRQGTFTDYLRDWDARHEEVLSWGKGMDPSLLPVAMTYERTVAVLTPPAKALLRLCAFLAPEPIPFFLLERAETRLQEAVALLREEESTTGTATADAEPLAAMADLAHYSLIEREVKAFSVHRMVQEAVRLRIPEARRRAWIECALKMVNDAVPTDSSDVRTWAVWNALCPHVEVVAILADEAGIADPTGRLMNDLGVFLQAKGIFVPSERWLRRALEIEEASFGVDHPNVAIRLSNLAALLQATNRLSEAEPMHRRALKIDESAYGPDHPKVATDLSNLAALLQATNRLSEAEPMYRRALEIDEAAYGHDHSNVAIRLNNLATLLKATNRLSEAEPLARRALFVFETSLGEKHPSVATALNNLAEVLRASKRLSEAEPLYRRALEVDEASFGPNHCDVARDLNNLALLLQDESRLDEAEPLSRRQLEILLRSTRDVGRPHPYLRAGINNYAGLLREMGRSEEEIRKELGALVAEYGVCLEEG